MRKHLVLVKTSKTHGEKRLCLLFRLFSNDDCSKTSVISNFSPSETVLMGEITRAVYKLMWISWNILQGDHKSNCILRWAARRHTFYIMRKFKGWNWTLEPQKIIFLTLTIPQKCEEITVVSMNDDQLTHLFGFLIFDVLDMNTKLPFMWFIWRWLMYGVAPFTSTLPPACVISFAFEITKWYQVQKKE